MAETRRGLLLRLKRASKAGSLEGLTAGDILLAAEVTLAADMYVRHSRSAHYWRELCSKVRDAKVTP
jgi:hypothetical protein